MKKLLKHIIRLGLVLLVSFSAFVYADIDEGLEAIQSENYSLAFKEFAHLAVEGDAHAQFYLGVMYNKGYGVEQSLEKAIQWYEEASSGGIPEAQYNLGLLHYNGEGAVEDYVEAARWMRLAAEAEMTKAQYEMGLFYFYGEGVKEDNQIALSWFLKAADKGHANANYYLGLFSEKGYGVNKDLLQALTSYITADLLGSDVALKAKDRLWARVNSWDQDNAARAAAYDLYNLGAFEQAWNLLASQENIIHPDSQYLLAVMLQEGRGVEQNYVVAVEWYEKAANNVVPHSWAARDLAYLYATGTGVEINYGKALSLYLQAAQEKDLNATKSISVLYENGYGVDKNLVEAFAWLLVAYQIDETRLDNKFKAFEASLSEAQIEAAYARSEEIINAFEGGNNPLVQTDAVDGKVQASVKALERNQ